MSGQTYLGLKAIPNATVFTVDLDALALDMQERKTREKLTYRDIGDMCGCHLQTVYKFLSGDRSIGGDLFAKFCKFAGKSPQDYNVQKRLPGF